MQSQLSQVVDGLLELILISSYNLLINPATVNMIEPLYPTNDIVLPASSFKLETDTLEDHLFSP